MEHPEPPSGPELEQALLYTLKLAMIAKTTVEVLRNLQEEAGFVIDREKFEAAHLEAMKEELDAAGAVSPWLAQLSLGVFHDLEQDDLDEADSSA